MIFRRAGSAAAAIALASFALFAQAPPGAPAAQAPAAPGQPPAPAGRGGGRGGPALVSPEVNDTSFTVRYRAPEAREVTVIGEIDGKDHPMTKGENGIWSATIGPLAPDVYNYQFRVDGIVTMDPANPSVKLGFGTFPPASMVQIAGDDFADARDVPHGSVRMETYHSKTFGVPRTVWVYTPPGYDRGNTRYPVFYLLHGSGNIDSSWMMTGRANYILDNLIAEGKAKPMIVINPLGYPRQGIGTGPERPVTAPPGAAPAPGSAALGGGQFGRDLLDDVVPFVDKTFRTITTTDNRAIGGLSMGGGQTAAIAFANPDRFRYVVIMSAGSNNADQAYPEFFKDAAAANKKFKLLWVGVGKDDALVGAGSRQLDETLTRHNITHTYRVTEGRHEWVVWRHHLREVAPLLFK